MLKSFYRDCLKMFLSGITKSGMTIIFSTIIVIFFRVSHHVFCTNRIILLINLGCIFHYTRTISPNDIPSFCPIKLGLLISCQNIGQKSIQPKKHTGKTKTNALPKTEKIRRKEQGLAKNDPWKSTHKNPKMFGVSKNNSTQISGLPLSLSSPAPAVDTSAMSTRGARPSAAKAMDASDGPAGWSDKMLGI